MEYTLKGFKSTGFSPSNIPDTPALLNTTEVITFPNVWLLQDRDRTTVKISTSYDVVKNIDYCLIGSAYYWVTSIKMLNENVAEVNLLMDCLTTIGINNLTVSNGWCIRRHVAKDTLFGNVLDEGFQPSEPLKLDLGQVLSPGVRGDENNTLKVVTSTVNLSGELNTIARTFTDKISALSVTVPTIPPVFYETVFTSTHNSVLRRTVPSTGCFNYTNAKVKENVQAVRGLGIEQAITGSYILPLEYISFAELSTGLISIINGKVVNLTSNLSPIYKVVNNYKALSGQFQKVVLTSVVSNSQEEYDAHDIVNPLASSGNFSFRIFCDPSPEGRPYCKPTWYHTNTSDYFMGVVAGQTWQNQPIAYQQSSGIAVDVANSRRNIQTTTVDGGISSATSLLGAVGSALSGNIGGAVGGVGNALSTGIGTLFDVNNQKFQQNVKNNIVAPTINFARVPGLENYIGNFFYVYRYRLSDNDTARFDNFLTQFGYSVSEPLTWDCFTGRRHFNFVQANNVNIKSSYPLSIRLGAINQLENGVRIWHTLPDITAMYGNPIV